MEYLDGDVPADDLLAVGERRERERDVRRLVETVGGPRARGQGPPAGDVVGLDVGVDDVRDLRPLELGVLEVALEVVGLWVYDRRRPVARSPEHVGRAAGLGIQELPEDHGHASFSRDDRSRLARLRA
jgi:hypothetical protein